MRGIRKGGAGVFIVPIPPVELACKRQVTKGRQGSSRCPWRRQKHSPAIPHHPPQGSFRDSRCRRCPPLGAAVPVPSGRRGWGDTHTHRGEGRTGVRPRAHLRVLHMLRQVRRRMRAARALIKSGGGGGRLALSPRAGHPLLVKKSVEMVLSLMNCCYMLQGKG